MTNPFAIPLAPLPRGFTHAYGEIEEVMVLSVPTSSLGSFEIRRLGVAGTSRLNVGWIHPTFEAAVAARADALILAAQNVSSRGGEFGSARAHQGD